jgi:hypothetical protein
MFYLTIFILCQFQDKLTGTLSGFITRVKPAPSGLLCAWREVLILRQHKAPWIYKSERMVRRVFLPQHLALTAPVSLASASEPRAPLRLA